MIKNEKFQMYLSYISMRVRLILNIIETNENFK